MDENSAVSYVRNLKRQSNEWKHPGSPRPKKLRPTQCAVKVMFIVAYDTDALRCTSKADGIRCLLLHIPAAPPSSSAQEKTTTLGGTEPIILHDNSRSYTAAVIGPLALLAMGDSGTSIVLTRLRSLRQSERTTARDPVERMR